jgi:hypothetical protein
MTGLYRWSASAGQLKINKQINKTGKAAKSLCGRIADH